MTNAPVKDAAPILNFQGNMGKAVSAAAKAGSMGSFGSIMNKASYGNSALGAGANAVKGKTDGGSKISQAHARKESLKTDTGKASGTEKPAAEQEQCVAEAAGAMVQETAKELNVSEQDVRDAMEALGMEETDILSAGSLTKLVLMLSGETDPLLLLTDEGLYGKVQNLLESLAGIRDSLQEELSLNTEELDSLLAGPNTGKGLGEQAVKAETAGKEQPKITVTVEESARSVQLSTDEKGNVIQVESVTAKENGGQDSSKQESKENGSRESKAGVEHANPMLETMLKNEAVNAEAAFEQIAAEARQDTQEIMDQILNYMKIQLKPGMSQLEMQLHPESLGTLHIQLMSKGGEVTAQFHVQNEAVKAAIESQLTVLKETLKEQGVKIEAVEVTVESHGFESNLWQGQDRNENNSYQESRRAPRRLNLNALEEGFEEEALEEEVLAAEMMRANGGTVDYTV